MLLSNLVHDLLKPRKLETLKWSWGMGRRVGVEIDLEYSALGVSLVLLLF